MNDEFCLEDFEFIARIDKIIVLCSFHCKAAAFYDSDLNY